MYALSGLYFKSSRVAPQKIIISCPCINCRDRSFLFYKIRFYADRQKVLRDMSK